MLDALVTPYPPSSTDPKLEWWTLWSFKSLEGHKNLGYRSHMIPLYLHIIPLKIPIKYPFVVGFTLFYPFIFTNYVFPFVGLVAEVFVKRTSLAKIAECGIAGSWMWLPIFWTTLPGSHHVCYLDFPPFLVYKYMMMYAGSMFYQKFLFRQL